jgi:hypothetical protein
VRETCSTSPAVVDATSRLYKYTTARSLPRSDERQLCLGRPLTPTTGIDAARKREISLRSQQNSGSSSPSEAKRSWVRGISRRISHGSHSFGRTIEPSQVEDERSFDQRIAAHHTPCHDPHRPRMGAPSSWSRHEVASSVRSPLHTGLRAAEAGAEMFFARCARALRRMPVTTLTKTRSSTNTISSSSIIVCILLAGNLLSSCS